MSRKRNPELTKETILARSAEVFNQKGYGGTSISDLMDVTGLKKGGIYNHFSSKEELAVESFNYAVKKVSLRFAKIMETEKTSAGRLRGMIDVFRDLARDYLVKGGCPVMNTAIESDDAYPALRIQSQYVMLQWQNVIKKIIQKGIKYGEMRSEADQDRFASVMISSLEGAVMMSRLYGDSSHMDYAASMLERMIELDLLTIKEP